MSEMRRDAMGPVTLVTAALVMFLLGAIYAYGVLLPALMRSFDWERATAAFPHAVLLFVYAVGMAAGGMLQDRSSPTLGVILGGLAFGGGLLWGSAAQTLLGLVLSYGVLGGIGFGFAYVACVTAVMRTFPARRGLAAGVVVGAFGLGAFVWAPLAQSLLAPLDWAGIFRHFGALCFVLIPVLGVGVRAPRVTAEAHAETGMTLGQALRSALFWFLFVGYTLVTAVGLLLLAHFVNIGGDRGMTAAQAAWLLSISAVGSGSGRFFMGWLSDRVGRLPCLIGATVAETLLLVALIWAAHPALLYAIALLTGFAFGTWLSLYGPTATDFFGLKAAGAIYGVLYLSYGIGGLIGPTLGGALADLGGGYTPAFITAAILTTGGALFFLLTLRRYRRQFAHLPALAEEFPLGDA